MKKNILIPLCLFLLLLGETAGAQPVSFQSAHSRHLQHMLSRQQNNPNGKLLGSERTTGQSTLDNLQNTLVDSVLLTYHTNGYSAFDLNTMMYAYNNPYLNSPLFEYTGDFLVPQITYKSLKRWTIDPNTLAYGLYQTENTNYDANNNMLGDTILFADSATRSNLILAHTFGPGTGITKGYCNRWSAGKSDSTQKRFFRYDAQNRLVCDSAYQFSGGKWNKASRTVYSYSTGNTPFRIDHFTNYYDTTYSKPLVQVLKYENTFDATGRLLTVRASYFDGSQLAPYVVDTFSYAAGVSFHTSWKEHQFDPINNRWTAVSYMHKQLNASGLPDVVWVDAFDIQAKKWTPYLRYHIQYNANNNPIRMDEYIHDFISFPVNPDFTTLYYYENISGTTGNPEIIKYAPELIAYPNPSGGNTTILLPENCRAEKHAVGLKLFDASGNEVSCDWKYDENKIALTAGVSRGAYFFVLSTNGAAAGYGRLIVQ